MIVLGRIERGGRNKLRHDGLVEFPGRRQLLFGRLGDFLLLFIVIENGGPILTPTVGKLSIGLRRVYISPEDLDELLIANLVRIKNNLDGLGVSGFSRGDVFISRVWSLTAGVP